ncbi:amidohydrolase family protein [Ensifer sp.]|jgi:predicted TIM-barrel fold metal-dependent hydrolase|uniref:amidohydrolase family protein n=1 Tax=Ensifer sp. TaxID=1872086 RepID=UPI002E0FFF2F|nr:amidohydrolase family protein [Ensifer sp.]
MGVDLTGPVAAVTRRDALRFVTAGLMANVLSGCRHDWPPAAACDLPYPIIDVHCHFFNAADVPVDGLVRYLALREGAPDKKTSKLVIGLAVVLVVALAEVAPEAKDELAVLLKRARPLSDAELALRRDEQLHKAMRALIALANGERTASEFVPRSRADQSDFEVLLGELADQANLPRNFQKGVGGVSDEDVAAIVKAAKSHDIIGVYVRFVQLMQDYRKDLAESYLRIYGSRCSALSLITPSILDFEKWIGGKVSPQHDQINVMHEIQQVVAREHGIRMHSFVSFDPRREARDPGSSLKNVEDAIMCKGFIGVKLYPPMGFKAIGNETERGIDTALRRLYDWCCQHDVPIMAHAENSLGARCGNGSLASPQHWRELLKCERYTNLRINLAHFGGFDEELREGEWTGVVVNCKKDKFSGPPSWEQIIGETIHDDHRLNLYADLSYLSELVSTTNADLHYEIRKRLNAWIQTYDTDARHLMFGTDWSMMSRERNYNNYVPRMVDGLAKADISDGLRQNIFWRNASRFLGLDRPGPTRDRIAAYCVKHELGVDWLADLAMT